MTSSGSSLFNREGMNVGFYSAIIHAQVLNTRGEKERAYDSLPDTSLYWCFVDLVDSSNYRITRGSRAGYIRSETFFSLVRSVISYCPEVRLIKEIGDSAFLAGEFRDILECLLLIDHEAFQLRQLVSDSEYPFAVRGGIGYGPAKRLVRPNDDFVGSAIDQLARVMGERSSSYNLFIHADAYGPMEQVVGDYREFLEIKPAEMLSAGASKGMKRPVYYHWLEIDRSALAEFGSYFVHWRHAIERQRVGEQRDPSDE